MPKSKVNNWMKIYHIVAITIASVFVIFSVFTYFDRLSQYQTADQDLTLSRINIFLEDYDKPVLTNGSNLSYVVVGYPGSAVKKWLDSRYQEGNHIIGNIYYTRMLPFTLIQVIIALILLLSSVLLLGKLSNWNLKKDHLYYLLATSVVLNFPMLKGLVKVLKYDALSVIIGALALLTYLVAKKEKNVYYFLSAIILSALAFIEKDTVLSLVFFIIICELFLPLFDAQSLKDFIKRITSSLLIISSVFLSTVFITVPKIWHHPSELKVIFASIPSYGISISNYKLIVLLILALVGLFLCRSFLKKACLRITRLFSLKTLLLILALLFLSAIFYQANNMKWTHSASVNAQIEERGLFAGKEMAGVALTTLDKSPAITRAKLLFNEGRLIIYFLPELIVIMLLISPLIVRKKNEFIPDSRTVKLFVGFMILNLVAYAYLLTPIEAKYLTLVMFGLVLLMTSLLVGTLKQLSNKSMAIGLSLTLLTVLVLIIPSFQNAPAHFGYMNIFRNRSYENISSINDEDYTFWTWMGWGETSYNLARYAGNSFKNIVVNVGYDYLPPLQYPPNVRLTRTDKIRDFITKDEMDSYLKELELANIDFIIVSKNTANRAPLLNQVLKEKRNKAVYVDRHGGIEYGWLFRPSDLVQDN